MFLIYTYSSEGGEKSRVDLRPSVSSSRSGIKFCFISYCRIYLTTMNSNELQLKKNLYLEKNRVETRDRII